MSAVVNLQDVTEQERVGTKKGAAVENVSPLVDGVVYSKRKEFRPFSTPPLEAYARILGDERTERLQRAAERLRGLKLLEINATAQGGGVAEMLYSSVPFLDMLGIETEWKVIKGNEEFFKCTKSLHNMLQGMKSTFLPEMERSYISTLDDCVRDNLIDYHPDVVIANDPQPFGLASYLKKPGQTWLWRCHIDIEDTLLEENQGLWDFMSRWIEHYNAAIFSAAHYIISRWPLPSFIIPPFIDPLSEKNRELSQQEIDKVLAKYNIDSRVPIIAQVGRFDPWKGIDRTIATYRRVREEMKCQMILAGGMASDDPEGEKILAKICEETKDDEDIHVLNLSLANRLENWREINALQRAANVIMQPSTREGFGLVITEALWKGKPVIAANVGAIPLQLRDGDTGHFFDTTQKTAQRVINWLKNPSAAEAMGKRAREFVGEHFLLPDRIADYLMTMDMTLNGSGKRPIPADCIISFHPWFKMSKWRK
ncbi:glycosyltransferase [Chloroflexota bacterium]